VLDPEVKDTVWRSLEPPIVAQKRNPLGGQRRCKSDRACREVMVVRLARDALGGTPNACAATWLPTRRCEAGATSGSQAMTRLGAMRERLNERDSSER